MQQIAIGVQFQFGGSHKSQLFPGGYVLNETGHVRDAQLAEGESAMAAVVEDQPILGVDDVEKIRAEAHCQSDYTHQDPRMGLACNMIGL